MLYLHAFWPLQCSTIIFNVNIHASGYASMPLFKLILTRNSCKPQLPLTSSRGEVFKFVLKMAKKPSKMLNFSCSKFLRISLISIFLHSEFHQIVQLESSAKVVQNSTRFQNVQELFRYSALCASF